MKKLIIAVMLVAFAFTVAYAADSVTYDSKKGAVTFNHKDHADKLGCEACHEGTPAQSLLRCPRQRYSAPDRQRHPAISSRTQCSHSMTMARVSSSQYLSRACRIA